MKIFSVSIFGLLLVSSDSALAGWKNANWGMSKAEVLQSTSYKALKTNSHDRYRGCKSAELKLRHTSKFGRLIAYFCFRNDRLWQVTLVPFKSNIKNCDRIRNRLIAYAGKAAEIDRDGYLWMDIWPKNKNGNRVIIASILGKACTLNYQPVRATNNHTLMPPRYNVATYCANVAKSVGDSALIQKGCLGQEQRAYDSLKARWSQFPQPIKTYCDKVARSVGESYMILEGCIKQENKAKATMPIFKY